MFFLMFIKVIVQNNVKTIVEKKFENLIAKKYNLKSIEKTLILKLNK